MRIVELVVLLAFVAVMALLISRLVRSGRAVTAEWEPVHRFEGGSRRVYVQRGGELEPVGEVHADDPEYDDRFLALMSRARERAATLNSER
jgi:hypothetical protein